MAWLQRTDPELLFASVITLGEIRLGIQAMPAGKRRDAHEVWLSNGLPAWFAANLISVDRQTADIWGRLTVVAKDNGLALATSDGLIGATALQHGLSLVTRNTKDFTGLGIALIDPWLANTP